MSYENLPEEQEKGFIDQLEQRMQSEVPKDLSQDKSLYKRFVRARNYDVDAAEVMLRDHINWRVKNKIDKILTDYKPPEVAAKYITITKLGFNWDDTPVMFIDLVIDTRGILKALKKTEVLLHIVYYLETVFSKLNERNKEVNKEEHQFTLIVDFKDFSLLTATHKPTLEIFVAIVTMFDRHFPERLKTAYCVNTSYYFQLIWVVLKQFLSGRTFQKVGIMTKDYTQSELHKKINNDILPAYLGGKLTDSDGDTSCKKLLKIEGPVPEEYFSARNIPIPRISGAQKIVVNRMSKAEIKLIVINAGCSIDWEFETKSKDIGFALFFKENENSQDQHVELIPNQRIETETSPETGVYYCEKRGVYILEFDNTYSWASSKEVYYRASITKCAVGKLELTN